MAVPLVDMKAHYAGLKERLDRALLEHVATQQFILGAAVERLEREVAEFVGAPHAVGCASGTDALLLSLRALELPAGTEVVVPAFTFFATAGAVWNAGLRPRFVDVDEATFNVTPDTVRPALDGAGALIPVHLYGQMAAMAPLLELARAREVVVIEDAAQSFGARQRHEGEWRPAGSIGDVGCYSFFPAKILGGYGDGGMIVCRDDVLAERLRKLRVHGGLRTYHHELVGTNSRLDALQAAILSVKLPEVPRWVERRRWIAARYAELLGDVAQVASPASPEINEHAFNVFTLRVADRDGLKAHLDATGIGNAVYYPLPLHLQPCFAELGYRAGELPVSERLAGDVISLPVYPELEDAQVEEVCRAVRGYYG
ncbi:MAG: DegT/DnrJ/EryC1/StrS family aminotransferase [Longimicrobiales bacterium]